VEASLPLFRKVFALDRKWAILPPRLVKVGQLPDDPSTLEQILKQAPEGERP
jgi:hypothetical protein